MQISDFLDHLRQRLRRSILLEGLSRVVVVLGLLAFGLCALDYLFNLPSFLRLLVLCGYIFIVVDTVYLRLWRPLHVDMSDEQLLSLLERRVPELDGRAFVAHDELPLSQRDKTALQELLTAETMHRVVPASHMKQWLASSGSVVALVGLLLVLNSDVFTVAMQRLLLPYSDSEWQRSTVIRGGLDGREVVAEDQPFVFVFERLAGDSNPLEVRWENQDGVLGHKVFEGMNSNWREVLQLPPGAYDFAVSSGDSRAVRCAGIVVERPQLRSVTATINAPEYLRAEAETVSSLDISVLPGSTVDIELAFLPRPGRQLEHVRVTVNEEEQPFSYADGTLSGSLLISEESKVQIYAADQDQIEIKPEPVYTIKTQTDHVPNIQLSGPRRSEQVTLRAIVDLRMNARDDYGLAAIDLGMRREPEEGDSEQKELMARSFEQYQRIRTERFQLTIAEHAVEKDRLVLRASAADANSVTGPGVGQSNEIELLVVSEQVLRREIQRAIAEARDKVQQGRDAIMPALSDEEKVRPQARQTASLAQKATQKLEGILRRWKQNQLPESEMENVAEAEQVLKSEVQDKLMQASTVADASQADAQLAKAYRLLSSAVNSSDLPQELASLIEQQKELTSQARDFVLKYSVKEMDEAAKNTQAALSDRQRELSTQVRSWQQKLQESNDARYQEAKELSARERPAARLSQAAKNLASNDQRQRAVSGQQQATAAMEEMYRMLQGMQGEQSMSQQLSELAQRQQDLANQVKAGQAGDKQQQEQRKLEELTRRLLEQLQRKGNKNSQEEKAAKHTAGARDAQQSASQSMQRGDQQQAQTDTTTAAKLLKQAQKALDDEQEQQEDDEEEETLKILAMLKEMRGEQVEVVSEALALYRQMGEVDQVNFRQKRQIASVDAVEEKLLRTLRNEAYPTLEKAKMQIAIWGLKRLESALVRTHKHLQTPALGQRGVNLTKTVLREIDRLIDIIENLPKPNANQEGDGDGQGGGQGGPSPFPPLAEMNMLAQMQELILHYTMSRYGQRLPAEQRQLSEMIGQMSQSSKEGSRSRVLLERTKRAMDLASRDLMDNKLGVGAQHNQRLAVMTLQQLMREAKRQQNNNQGKKNKQDQQNADQQQQSSKPNQGQSSASNQSASDARAQAQTELRRAPAAVQAIVEQKGIDWYLKLPPKIRKSLIEVNVETLPAGAQELYRRYLEILEDIEP